MRIKYLYGKREYLCDFYMRGGPIRFTDINNYSDHVNATIRDDESRRVFRLERITKLDIGDYSFDGSQVKNLSISLPTRRCHILCLSNTGNSAELFNRFKADVCIAIDVDKLEEFLRYSAEEFRYEVVGRNVEYFSGIDATPHITVDKEELVFKKELLSYGVENEYRIAIFYANDHKTVAIVNGKYVPMFGDNNFIEVGLEGEDGLSDVVVEVSGSNGEKIR